MQAGPIELLGFAISVIQSPFAALTSVLIQKRNFLKARVIIHAYNDLVRLLPPEPLVVEQPKSTRVEGADIAMRLSTGLVLNMSGNPVNRDLPNRYIPHTDSWRMLPPYCGNRRKPVKETERTTHTQCFRIQNAHEHALKLYVEPWGEEFSIPPNARYEMLSKGPDSITRPRGKGHEMPLPAAQRPPGRSATGLCAVQNKR